MVVKGRFSVQLVDAQTKVLKDGKIYVEAEPDVEYYISVNVSFKDDSTPVIFTASVDGECLGFEALCRAYDNDNPEYNGRYEVNEEGDAKDSALLFEKLCEAEVSESENEPLIFGTASVHFYEAIPENGPNNTKDPAEAHAPRGSIEKFLRSSKGLLSITSKCTEYEFKRGHLIKTITLQYCSTVGLVHAEILPAWDQARRDKPFEEGPIDPTFVNVKPTIQKVDKVVGEDGTTFAEAKEYALFDLTKLLSDNDEEGKDDKDEDDKNPAAPKNCVQEKEKEPELQQETDNQNCAGEKEPDKANAQIKQAVADRSTPEEKKQGKPKMNLESDEESDSDDIVGMDLRQFLGRNILRGTKAYHKQIDNFFINEYHGMPRSLFANVYRRSRVFDAIKMSVDTKGMEKFVEEL